MSKETKELTPVTLPVEETDGFYLKQELVTGTGDDVSFSVGLTIGGFPALHVHVASVGDEEDGKNYTVPLYAALEHVIELYRNDR